jgi:pantothenate kinase-related protein Tda10
MPNYFIQSVSRAAKRAEWHWFKPATWFSVVPMTAAEGIRAACAIIESAPRATPNDRRTDAPLIVGIDGAGGAGKSTLARGIDDANPGRASIVRCDDFYHPLTGAQYSRLTVEEAYENYFDWRRR